jgi:hypothetical protein
MVVAGFRNETMTVPKDDMAALVEALKKRLTPEQIEAVIEHLTVPRQAPDKGDTHANKD